MSAERILLKCQATINFGFSQWVAFCRFLAVFLIVSVPVAGSSGPVEPIEDIAARSDWIVVGKVAEMAVSEPVPGSIVTRLVFTNVVSWKGTVSNRFELLLPGGVLGRRRLMLTGAPSFSLGQEWLVFTLKNPRGEAILSHPTQGALQVAPDDEVSLPASEARARPEYRETPSVRLSANSLKVLKSQLQKTLP